MIIKVDVKNGDVISALAKFEEKIGTSLSTNQRILLCEIGTLEKILAIMMIGKGPVSVRKIKHDFDMNTRSIKRRVAIGLPGRDLIIADTVIKNSKSLPYDVMAALEGGAAIGRTLAEHNVESLRRLKTFFFNDATEQLARRYEIVIKGKVVFDIMEYIPLSLFNQKALMAESRWSG